MERRGFGGANEKVAWGGRGVQKEVMGVARRPEGANPMQPRATPHRD